MKGPDAAMVAAIRVLRAHGLPGRGRVLVTLHGMHESGGNEPLHALIARGIHGDAVITGELGGGVELPIGGLGLSFWEIVVERRRAGDARDRGRRRRPSTRSRSGGSFTRPSPTCAIASRTPRPRIPSRRCSSASSSSGDYPNRLPVRAELAGTRRHDETMDLAAVGVELEALVDAVRQETGAPIELRFVPIAEPFSVDPAEPIVRAMSDAHRELYGNELRLTRGRVATNAVHFVQEAGIPAVGYGPDPITNHSDHEELAVSELSRIAGGFALASALYLERAAR